MNALAMKRVPASSAAREAAPPDKTFFMNLVPFKQHEALMRRRVLAAMKTDLGLYRYFIRYTSWNGYFGAGVATLAGKLARCRGLFIDPGAEHRFSADRSVYVASYFFDAARDEFDDRDTVHRDTHRCLAQATTVGIHRWLERSRGPLAAAPGFAAAALIPDWLRGLNQHVAAGYGAFSHDQLEPCFAAIGYHIGSELLADREFSIIDQALQDHRPELRAFLLRSKIDIAGEKHGGYQWIRIHSGQGGAVEADHLAFATEGLRRALLYTEARKHQTAIDNAARGFRGFAQDHHTFFNHVLDV